MNLNKTERQIMSAMQSDAFNEEACKKILRDAQMPREDYDNLVRDAMKWRHQLCAAQPKPEWTDEQIRACTCTIGDKINPRCPSHNPSDLQPKPESWREIAREQPPWACSKWGGYEHDWLECPDCLKAYDIQNEAAQHPFDVEVCYCGQEAAKHDMSHDIRVMGEDATSRQPPAKATDDKQEWTLKSVIKLVGVQALRIDYTRIAQRIADAHNAELAKERDRVKYKNEQGEFVGRGVLEERNEQLRQDLAAERQRRKQSEKEHREWLNAYEQEALQHEARIKGLEQQLLSAQAAIEKHNRLPEEDCNWPINVDLSTLREHDEKLRAGWEKQYKMINTHIPGYVNLNEHDAEQWLSLPNVKRLKHSDYIEVSGVAYNTKDPREAIVQALEHRREHDAEARKPLVDALEEMISDYKNPLRDYAVAKRAIDALAKVKRNE